MSSEIRMVIEPGDLLCFSGAHVHATRPERPPIARVQRGAANGRPRRSEAGTRSARRGRRGAGGSTEWFRSMVDGEPLTREDAEDEHSRRDSR